MKTIIVSLLLSYTTILTAQLSHNFELLDHRARHSSLGAHELVNDQIFYVSHNDRYPMTSLNVCNDNNEIQTIFESPFSSRSKKIITSDSTFRIYIYDLFDYDVSIYGMYEFNYSPSGYTLDTLLGYQNPISLDAIVVYDVVKDSSDHHYILDFDGLNYVVDQKIMATFSTDGISDQNLYQSSQSKVYVYGKNNIWHFDGVDFILAYTFNQDILDIRISGVHNLVLFKGVLMVIGSDFETVLSEWNIPEDINSIDQVITQDSTILTLSTESNNIDIYSISSSNQSQLLHSSSKNESESFTGFVPLNDDRFLLMGSLSTGDICYNLFFRNHSFEENTTYLRPDVDINTFKLIQTGFDTSSFYVPTPGDTFFYLRYYYDVQLDLQNNSDDTVNHFNVFSKDYFNPFGPGPLFRYDIKEPIASLGSLRVDTSFSISPIRLSAFYIAAPGANYLFNQSDKKVVLADFTSSLQPLRIDNSLTVSPNPTSNFLNVLSDSELERVCIYNSSGVLVFLLSGIVPDKIDISQLDTGTYFGVCTFKNNKRNSNFSFVKI